MPTATHELDQLLPALSDDQVKQVVDFAKFLRWSDERAEWREFGRQQLAKAYGDDEPEYTLDDLRKEPQS